MLLTEAELRKVIQGLIISEHMEQHRCIDGRMVPSDSLECLEDLEYRLEDADHHRSSHSCGTENRVYYNGLMKGLRKRRNRLRKQLAQ